MDLNRRISLLLAVLGAAVAALAFRPDPDPGDYLNRIIETLLVMGVIGGILNAGNWQSENRLMRGLSNPRFAWPAILVGSLVIAAREWLPHEWLL